ncbi:MAG: hypothetical protein ACI9GH_000005 [Candidatus Paceibacteria bacterium]|jgi:hypothetical protein
MLVASVTGAGQEVVLNRVGTQPIEVEERVRVVDEIVVETTTLTTKEYVNEYFKDTPILVDVAYCESGIRQFSTNGQPLRGIVNPQDVGVMQINEKYHLDTSVRLGIDIYTLEGNLAYGKYLYETQGTAPWEYSSKCWGKTREVALLN